MQAEPVRTSRATSLRCHSLYHPAIRSVVATQTYGDDSVAHSECRLRIEQMRQKETAQTRVRAVNPLVDDT